MKAETIVGPVGATQVCCHSERSEESLCGFAHSKDREREILRFAQNDTRLGVCDCSSAARSRQCGLKDSINAIFLSRNHPLICFSRVMAIRGPAFERVSTFGWRTLAAYKGAGFPFDLSHVSLFVSVSLLSPERIQS